MGFEPTTFCLASRRSTTELRPLCPAYNALSSWVKLPKTVDSVNNKTVYSVYLVFLVEIQEKKLKCRIFFVNKRITLVFSGLIWKLKFVFSVLLSNLF